ncbi:MAG: DUF4349 domain-containing protein [Actinobacteria bacterium]|nr:DUF4349 domain-containing protein [Actinomycetota bacterium]
MPARPHNLFRSPRGRAVAVGLAGLLAAGAVVAALSGEPGGTGGSAQKSAKSGASTAVAPAPAPALGAAPDAGKSLSAGAGTAGGASAPGPGASASSPGAVTALPAQAAADSAAAGATSIAEPPFPPGVGPTPAGLGGPPVPDAVAAGTSKVIKNATLTVSLKKGGLGDGYQQAVGAAAAVGGWVQASQTGGDQATVTLQVPSEKLEGVIGQIRGLGKVTTESESGDDVTAEYVDLQARIANWQAQEAVFVGLMAKAKTVPETIQIQQQLSTIQEQIEQLQGRQKYLDGHTSYSTVNLTLLEEGAVAKPEPAPGPKPAASTLGRAWHRSAGAALAVLGGTLVVLGVVVPLAAVVGLPAWLLAVALRRRGGRRPEEPAPAQG